MATIDYYFTPLSPFTYLAGQRLEEIAGRAGVAIAYKPFNLAEVGKHTGFVPLPDRPQARKDYRLAELRRISAHVGLPINLQPAHWPTNPVPASVAVIHAAGAGAGDVGAFVHGLMRATWAENKDIAQADVIRAVLEDTGFDPALADADMLGGVEKLERNSQDALEAGVFGSPTYVLAGEVFWGQDRLEYLDRALSA
ncbi:MAG: 2-hydroxychromene-2-carboxylate isomerase [Pseudomonadota bacterium]